MTSSALVRSGSRIRLRVIIVAVVMLLTGSTGSTSASHTGSCRLEALPLFEGQYANAQVGRKGAVAVLDGDVLSLCSGTAGQITFSSVWVGIYTPASQRRIIQIGYDKGVNDSRNAACDGRTYLFTAWGRDQCGSQSPMDPIPRRGALSDFRPHEFKIRLDTSDSSYEWVAYVDGSPKLSLPISSVCWTSGDAVEAGWLGETDDRGNAMGGSASDPWLFTTARFFSPQGGQTVPSWTAGEACRQDMGSLAPMFRCRVIDSDEFKLWTVQ